VVNSSIDTKCQSRHILFKKPCAFFPFILSLVLFLTYVDGALAQSDSIIIIKGVIDTVPNACYGIYYTKDGQEIADTVCLDAQGRFEYTTTSSEPVYLYLGIDNKPGSAWYNARLVGYYTMYTLWADPGKITYLIGKKGRGNQVVRNSPTQKAAEDFRDKIKQLHEQPTLMDEKAFSHAYDSVRQAYISENPSSYFSLWLLAGMAKFEKQTYPYIEHTLTEFPPDLKNTHLGKEIAQRLLINKALAVGSVMPDFEQADTSSKPVKLSDFRGKYVLVDFWASWCVPCRHDNPRLVKIYKRFSGKGFDILGISLDEKKGDWLQAIHHDGLPWTQVSDLKGFDNAVAKGFFIHAVPTKFLLDPNGVIIARDFNSGQLERKLEEIFGE